VSSTIQLDDSLTFNSSTQDLTSSSFTSANGSSGTGYTGETSLVGHSHHHHHHGKKEKWTVMLAQIVVPFFIAGFGMVSAGVLLDAAQVRFNR
jgi:hypothetical protein